MSRAPALLLLASLLVAPRAALAGPCNTEDSGACDPSAYCAAADGGAILDGAPGTCVPEPCLTAGDCADASAPICDTSQTPFACVECINTADCPGVLYCDPSTKTCVALPDGGFVPEDAAVGEDAGQDAGEDAAADAAARDAGATSDGASPADGAADASSSGGSGDEDAGLVTGYPSVADQGSLGGGAWDCDVAMPVRGGWTVIGALALSALVALRRKRR